jgi:hypothetical protein
MTIRHSANDGEIPLQAGIRQRLERLSELMGVPLVTLASHAIAIWVAQQERTLALIESLGAAVGGEMGTRLKAMLRTGLFARQQDIADRLKLTEAEVGAIAEQENLSTIAAAGLGAALTQSKEGLREIERLVRENIEKAKSQGQAEKAKDLEVVLAHFLEMHPSNPNGTKGCTS